MEKRDITREDAIANGYIIDDHCYPPVAYKGARFAPDKWKETYTKLETELMAKLEVLWRDACREDKWEGD